MNIADGSLIFNLSFAIKVTFFIQRQLSIVEINHNDNAVIIRRRQPYSVHGLTEVLVQLRWAYRALNQPDDNLTGRGV
ncbi:hypothetical protein FE839_18445 [Klebsiella indica]|uniref:Uncharacterized protein n=1 Tax=Klebsiella indica TaxID=2582917 RepID=A0A5R9LE01_9ENTR|nr:MULTISPECIES: hypothetical protein [Klebsiella]TLV11569.1 hypothetical protein FE839_18445 [Klebsiella indica]